MEVFTNLVPEDIMELLKSATGLGALGVTALAYVFVWCRVFSKAGYPAAWGFLALIPPVTWFVAPLILAFGPWPVLKETRELRRVQRAVQKADQRYTKSA